MHPMNSPESPEESIRASSNKKWSSFMYPSNRPLVHPITALACCACLAAMLSLIQVNVASAQQLLPDVQIAEVANHFQAPIVPVGYEAKDACVDCGKGADCTGCGCCDSCCGCGGWFHRWSDHWDGSFDLGLNGSEGNTRNTNFVLGIDAKRTFGLNTVSMDVDYFFNREEDVVTRDRLYALGRLEREIPNSPWSWFAQTWFEYDKFEDWRSRIGLHFGAARMLIDNECTTLKARLGAGASKKSEGPDQAWKPEVLLGADYELRLTDWQKFTATVDYFPDIGDFSSFRINTRAGWELLLSDQHDVSLAVNIFDRYDSTPSPGDPANELDYWLSIHWGF
jgi:hypothetical protein